MDEGEVARYIRSDTDIANKDDVTSDSVRYAEVEIEKNVKLEWMDEKGAYVIARAEIDDEEEYHGFQLISPKKSVSDRQARLILEQNNGWDYIE